MVSFDRQREQMVRAIASRESLSTPVLDAMRSVPREVFVERGLRAGAYEDHPLPIDAGQTISQPSIVAVMIDALEIDGSSRVLEVGSGSGYAAAILSRIAGEVFAVERHEILVTKARARVAVLGYDNIEFRHGDGTLGWAACSPYDAILVSAGGHEVPPALRDQLAVGGRLVIPIGADMQSQQLLRIRRATHEAFECETLGPVRFVPLVGS